MGNLSPPLRVRDRVCIVRQVGVRFAGNLALISSTRPHTHPSLACVPEGLIRSFGRRSAGILLRSRCSLSSRNGLSPKQERGRCATKQNNDFEGDYSVR